MESPQAIQPQTDPGEANAVSIEAIVAVPLPGRGPAPVAEAEEAPVPFAELLEELAHELLA